MHCVEICMLSHLSMFFVIVNDRFVAYFRTFFNHLLIFVCMCMFMCHDMLLEISEQLGGVLFLLPLCSFQGSNSGHQDWKASTFTH